MEDDRFEIIRKKGSKKRKRKYETDDGTAIVFMASSSSGRVSSNSSKDDDGEESIFKNKWLKYSLGEMQRGFFIKYGDFDYLNENPIDESPKFSYWGLILITNISVQQSIIFCQHYYKLFTIVENVDDYTLIVKINTGCEGNNMIINPGNTPCICSTSELTNPSHGKWFHFKYSINSM